jgi:hypothetical protein
MSDCAAWRTTIEIAMVSSENAIAQSDSGRGAASRAPSAKRPSPATISSLGNVARTILASRSRPSSRSSDRPASLNRRMSPAENSRRSRAWR